MWGTERSEREASVSGLYLESSGGRGVSCLNLGGRSCWQGVSVFSDIRELPLSEFVISRPRPLPTQLTIWCGILGRHASALATKRQYGSLSVYIATTLMAMLMRRTHQRYPRPCSEVDGRATSRWLVPTKDATALPSKVSWGCIGLDGARRRSSCAPRSCVSQSTSSADNARWSRSTRSLRGRE